MTDPKSAALTNLVLELVQNAMNAQWERGFDAGYLSAKYCHGIEDEPKESE